jgi:hypothetical protein
MMRVEVEDRCSVLVQCIFAYFTKLLGVTLRVMRIES